ncbi:MAG: hypothetical protein JWM56_271 [Candidatus Peribacteria bacterium]|nr:hypothetical protein [Candidatus Peribacteria bacterium]
MLLELAPSFDLVLHELIMRSVALIIVTTGAIMMAVGIYRKLLRSIH